MLLSLMACAVLVVGQLYVTLPLVSDISARFGVSSSIAGWVGTAFGLAYATGFLVLGGLSDHYGKHRVLIGSLMGTAAATALVAVAPSLPLLLAGRVLQGFAAASFPPTALAWVSDALPPPKRPLGISLLSLAFLGAAPLAQMAGAASAPLGLSTLMFALVPAYMLGALALALIPGKPVAPQVSIQKSPATARMPWGQRHLWSPWAATSTVLFAFVAFHARMSLAPPPGPRFAGTAHDRLASDAGDIRCSAAGATPRTGQYRRPGARFGSSGHAAGHAPGPCCADAGQCVPVRGGGRGDPRLGRHRRSAQYAGSARSGLGHLQLRSVLGGERGSTGGGPADAPQPCGSPGRSRAGIARRGLPHRRQSPSTIV